MASEEKSNSKPTSVVVVWDFDWSLINENSDFYPFRTASGDELIGSDSFGDTYHSWKQKQELSCFTNFMNDVAWPSLFAPATRRYTRSSFEAVLASLPVFDENKLIISQLARFKLLKPSDANSDVLQKNVAYTIRQFVVSDANTVLIETFLRKNGLYDCIEAIHTNPGQWEQVTETSDGKEDTYEVVRCQRYEKEPPQDCVHYGLNLCTPNMCKGRIVDKIRAHCEQETGQKVDMMVYIGDGGGDYCGCSRMRRKLKDFAMVRNGKTLAKVIKDEKGKFAKKDPIEGTIKYWSDGKELLKNFKEALPGAFE